MEYVALILGIIFLISFGYIVYDTFLKNYFGK
jgi:hypothetical protein